MKKTTKNGKVTLVPRNIHQIGIYEEDGKTIDKRFNYADWLDICTGINNKIKGTRKRRGNSGSGIIGERQWAIKESVAKLSKDRLYRVACLALQALIPSNTTFYLHYRMITGEEYDCSNSKFNSVEELLATGDRAVVEKWHTAIDVIIVPILIAVFERIDKDRDLTLTIPDVGIHQLPPFISSLIEKLREDAKRLPIYRTDFKGDLIDGLIYHETSSEDPPPAREALWKGGHHVSSTEIWVSQIREQGGSFGPICLFWLQKLTQPFEWYKGFA